MVSYYRLVRINTCFYGNDICRVWINSINKKKIDKAFYLNDESYTNLFSIGYVDVVVLNIIVNDIHNSVVVCHVIA